MVLTTLFRFLALSLFALILSGQGVFAAESQGIRVGHSSASVFNKAWEQILQEAGIQPDFVITTEDEKRRLFSEGQIVLDCCSIPAWRQRADERAVQLYSSHFFYSALHVVQRPDLPVRYRQPEDLKAYTVAVVRGHDYVHRQHFGATVEADSIDEALQLVADGYADMTVANRQELRFLLQGRRLKLELGPELYTLAMRARVHKSRPDLLDRLNAAIARLKDRGDIETAIGSTIRLDTKKVALALAGDADTRALRSVWRLILTESGIPYRIVEMPGARKRRTFIDGGVVLDCCVIPAWRSREEEQKIQLFSDPFHQSVEYFVLHQQSDLQIKGPDDLASLTVAVVRGFDLPQAHKAIIPGRNIEDVLHLVETRRAQVALVNGHDFYLHMQASPRALKRGPVYAVAPLRIRIHQSRADLLPAINAAIGRLKAEGTIELMLGDQP